MRIPTRLALLLLGASACSLLLAASPLRVSGPPPDVCANPPNYANCTDCHASWAPDSGSGMAAILGLPARYVPGRTYRFRVAVQDPNAVRWGFEVTCFDERKNPAGTLDAVDFGTQKIYLGAAEFVEHESIGTRVGTTGSTSWNVEWTAPPAGTGPVVFYAACNAANSDLTPFNDRIYTTCCAVEEVGGGAKDVIVMAQPHGTEPQQGESWTVLARVTNTSQSQQAVTLGTRAILPNGNSYPPTGRLGGPVAVSVAPGETENVEFVHAIPASARLTSATYQVFAGDPALGVLDDDTFDFTIVP